MKIQPFRRSGMWSFDGGLREQAGKALELAQRTAQELQDERDAIRKEQGEDAADCHQPHDRVTELHLLTTATVVLSAMAVEELLNLYGVKRMSDSFFSTHYERLGLVQKLSAVVATCCGVLLEANAEIVATARALSEARNRLVHPKTREVTPPGSYVVRLKRPLEEARECVAHMNRFLELFAELDPEAADIFHAI